MVILHCYVGIPGGNPPLSNQPGTVTIACTRKAGGRIGRRGGTGHALARQGQDGQVVLAAALGEGGAKKELWNLNKQNANVW